MKLIGGESAYTWGVGENIRSRVKSPEPEGIEHFSKKRKKKNRNHFLYHINEGRDRNTMGSRGSVLMWGRGVGEQG